MPRSDEVDDQRARLVAGLVIILLAMVGLAFLVAATLRALG